MPSCSRYNWEWIFIGGDQMKERIRQVTDFKISVSYICPDTNKKIDKNLIASEIEVESEECHICGRHIKIFLDIKCSKCDGWHEMIIRDDDPGSNSHRRHEIMEISHESNESNKI